MYKKIQFKFKFLYSVRYQECFMPKEFLSESKRQKRVRPIRLSGRGGFRQKNNNLGGGYTLSEGFLGYKT